MKILKTVLVVAALTVAYLIFEVSVSNLLLVALFIMYLNGLDQERKERNQVREEVARLRQELDDLKAGANTSLGKRV